MPESLHKQPAWLRIALSAIEDAVLVTDAGGRVSILNPVAQRLTGWKLEDALGEPVEAVFAVVDETHRDGDEHPVLRAARQGASVELSNHLLLGSRQGPQRPIDGSATPIRSGGGEPSGVVLVFRDVGEGRRQERTAREALAYAECIISTLREPLLVLDAQLRVVSANPAFFRTFATTEAETLEQDFGALLRGRWNLPELRALLERVQREGFHLADHELEHDVPGFGHEDLLLNACRIRQPGEDADLVVLGIQDITEQRGAKLALELSEVRHRRLFETARDGILILDAETKLIVDANPFMSELLGYEYEEFLGKELWEIGLLADEQASQAAYLEMQKQGYVRYEHLPVVSKRGDEVEVEFVSNFYMEGRRKVAQCNIRDITDRVRLERKMEEQQQALAELHHRKDEFLAMLSHELRGPLAPILSSLELMRLAGDRDDTGHRPREIIERQVGRLVGIVDDLLDMARITTGRIRLNQDHLDLNAVVQEGLQAARPKLEERGHSVHVSLPDEPIWLQGDAARLEQVVVNLLTNAAKYTDRGGRIDLSLERAGDEALIRVRDTGVGIAPDDLPHIFDLFTQVERSLDRSQGGLGIGLNLVKRLVEMHHGSIEVHSVLGQCSEFVVHLPVPHTAPAQPEPTPAPTERASRGHRILVVDDNLDAADSLAMLLRASDNEVRTAYDGQSALEMTREYRPDVVLLDIGLPGINGYELAEVIRAEPSLAGIVLVALTGYGQESDRRRSRQAGFDHHLVKPADIRRVREILAGIG